MVCYMAFSVVVNIHAWLSKNEKDYTVISTRKLCRVILFARIKKVFTNAFNKSNIRKKR